MSGLRFVIGPAPLDLKVFLGDRDITSDVAIKSLNISMGDPYRMTTVELEVYPESVEVLDVLPEVIVLEDDE